VPFAPGNKSNPRALRRLRALPVKLRETRRASNKFVGALDVFVESTISRV
jgi:hypothetical protein